MDGFHSPTRCPRKESMTAVEPFSCGALKLVPPQPPWRVGWPMPANDGSLQQIAAVRVRVGGEVGDGPPGTLALADAGGGVDGPRGGLVHPRRDVLDIGRGQVLDG